VRRVPPARTATRSDALDGIRALAALGVLAFHVWLYRDDRPHSAAGRSLIDRVLFEANVGLIAFFVLSGYLLYRPFARAAVRGAARPDLRRYAVRRAARILPAYYVCGAVCVVLYASVGPTTILPSARELPVFAVFAQNYSLDTLMQLNPVLWTLTIEIAFYAALPLLAIAGLRFGPRRTAGHALFLLLLVGVTVGWYALDWTRDWGQIPRKTLPAYIGHFAIGMLVALWLEHRAARGRQRLAPAATAGLMGAGVMIVVAQGYWHETSAGPSLARALFATLTCAAGFGLVVTAAAGGSGPSTAWFRSRVLVRAGVLSYGIYLWHLPLLLVLRDNGLLPQALWPRLLVVLAAALLAAAATWRWVEQPAIAWAARRRPGQTGAFTRSTHVIPETG
jgi:peptidoglycan/LPS O-acetylase OafA/YrhL